MRKFAIAFNLLFIFVCGTRLTAQSQNSEKLHELFDMSLEELMNIEVTVASKTSARLFDTPAAVSVLTTEDIRRMGVTNIPDALRAIPGVEVVRINSHTYSICIRGFTEEYSNKLLVMIDGRSIYTPTFSGVSWGLYDLILEDIERIEVVRGPGGTLWGANAVNGVINIITKHASDTQGALISGGGGTEDLGIGAVRYGGKLGDNVYYRFYTKYSNHDDSPAFDGTKGEDEWDIFSTGMRIDWNKTKSDKLTLQGDFSKACFGESAPIFSMSPPYSVNVNNKDDVKNGNILGRWTHTFSSTSDMALQFYYDHAKRTELRYGEKRDTFDIDFQHRFAFADAQQLIWGLGYRLSHDSYSDNSTSTFLMDPSHRNLNLFSGFIQDQISLVPDKLNLTVGLKLEHHDYTGLEYQPSARLAWTPDNRNTLWAAVSRAVRTPSRYERDIRFELDVIPDILPTYVVAYGSDDVDSEDLYSFELGYRHRPSGKFLLDISTFANKYRNLRTAEQGTPQFQPTPVPHVLMPLTFDNRAEAEAYGTEVFTTWKVTDYCRLSAAYSFLVISAHTSGSSYDTENGFEKNSPRNQCYLRSSFDLPHDTELDLSLKYVDSLPAVNVPSYLRFDVRFGWFINENTELNLVAQNLLDGKHPEFDSWVYQDTEAQRAFFAKLLLRF